MFTIRAWNYGDGDNLKASNSSQAFAITLKPLMGKVGYTAYVATMQC